MALADEKYLALTTYRRNGESSSTPVWIADLGDGTIGFTTMSSSLKVKRLANDDRVLLQPSDARGRPTDGTSPVSGRAVVSTADVERVRAKIVDKYGWQVTIVTLAAKVAKVFGRNLTSDAVVIVTLD